MESPGRESPLRIRCSTSPTAGEQSRPNSCAMRERKPRMERSASTLSPSLQIASARARATGSEVGNSVAQWPIRATANGAPSAAAKAAASVTRARRRRERCSR